MSDLERRYRRWVRAFYPADRSDEIVGTYLAISPPDRRRPSIADLADVVAGGLGNRLRATGIGPGLQLAAPLALFTATMLAGAWIVFEVNPWRGAWLGFERFGMSVTLGTWVWAAWLLAAVMHVLSPGRWTRRAIGLALVLTVAVVPAAAVLNGSAFRPPLFVLLAQVCLGLVSLAVPGRLPLWMRALPLYAAAAALPFAAIAAHDGADGFRGYGWPAADVLPAAGVALLLAALFVAARHGVRGVWALLVLLGPIGMMWLHPLAENLAVTMYGGGPNADWTTLALVALIVTGAMVLLLSAAVTTRLILKR